MRRPAPCSTGSTCTPSTASTCAPQVLGLTAHHLKPGAWHKVRAEVGDGAFRGSRRRSTSNCWRAWRRPTAPAAPGEFDCSAMSWFLDRARALGVEHGPPKPLLLGRHLLALGLKPGPRVGAILKQVYERQLDGQVTTVDEAQALAEEICDLEILRSCDLGACVPVRQDRHVASS